MNIAHNHIHTYRHTNITWTCKCVSFFKVVYLTTQSCIQYEQTAYEANLNMWQFWNIWWCNTPPLPTKKKKKTKQNKTKHWAKPSIFM